MLVTLGEGAYRVHEADTRSTSVGVGTAVTVADRLEDFAREYDLLGREIPSAPDPKQTETIRYEYNALVTRVKSELRRNAPGFMDDWRNMPPDVPSPVPFEHPPSVKRLFEFAAEQCRTIARTLRNAS